MFNDEILNARIKQIVFNLTVNRKNSSYQLTDVCNGNFYFSCKEVKDNYNLGNIAISICNYKGSSNVYDIEKIISSFEHNTDTLEDYDYTEKPSLSFRIGSFYYAVNLNRIEFAAIISELQDMALEFEDNLTYEVQRLSETPSSSSDDVESLDLKDPEA